MRWLWCSALVLSACYSPRFAGGAPCDVAADNCPEGQRCVAAAGGGGICDGNAAGNGAGIDAGTDAPPGATCLGKGLLGSLCLSQVPTKTLSLVSATAISTATVGGNSCSEIRAQPSGPSLCIVVGTTINIAAGATVRATGPNPLVLVATQSINVAGSLDVATHQAEVAIGAGARSAVDCASAGVDGLQGKPTNSNGESYGGGGGAGGSTGAIGGIGGSGGNNNNVGHGTPVAASATSVLVGGCPGGNGGNGDIDGSPGSVPKGAGAGGGGGGAVYLLAGDLIAITGQINASGSGGAGGKNGDNSSGGGGGGGAGGSIGLEAARISLTGMLFANGGGGGGGGGNDGTGDIGTAGGDPIGPLTAALPGTAINGGGSGGSGSVGSTVPAPGKNGSGQFPECAGGGGGGGPGVIRVFGVPPSSIGGTVSPPAR